jgi:hypothetical protein
MIDSSYMTTLIMIVGLIFAVPVDAVPDEATAQQIVDYALRTPTSDMDPKLANAFLDLDLKNLPKKKKEKALAKQFELQTLLKIGKGKKTGGMRWPTQDGCHPTPSGPGDLGRLMVVGFKEILEEEEQFLEQKTKCTELELQCEFTLTILLTPRKTGPPKKQFFLHENDPISALLAEYRNGKAGGQTKFFGGGVFSCNH